MAFVVTAGQLADLDRRPAQARPAALQLTDTSVAEYAYLWITQPAVRTVVTFLARNIASLPCKVYERRNDTDRRRVTDPDPLARIIAQPQPLRGPYSFFNSVMHDLGIYDRAYRIKVRGQSVGEPRALLRAHPKNMRVVGDSPFAPDGYVLSGNRGNREFATSEIVHWHGYHPDDDRDGCSPLEALRRTLMEEFYSGQFREQLWRNGARMSGYLKRPLGAPDWYKPIPNAGGESARDRFRRDWRAQYTGDGPQAGGTPVLEDGMEWVQASISPEQAQALEHRKLSREEVAAAYFIQPTMIGMLDHATFSNVREQHKQLYMDTLGPWLALLEEGLNLQLVPEYGARRYVEFDLSAKLAGSFEEQAAVLQSSVGAPWLTRNEARAMNNRPPLDGGDELITPLNVVEGGQASPRDATPDSAREAPSDTPSTSSRGVELKARAPKGLVDRGTRILTSTFDRQARAITSRLKARPATPAKADVDEVFDRERWDAELTADLYSLNEAVAHAAAAKAVTELGWDLDGYDVDRTLPFLQSNASRVAGGVNGATAKALADALTDETDPLEAVRALFDRYKAQRAEAVATAQVTSISGFGTTEAARQRVEASAGDDEPLEAVKTWRTTSPRPRPTHAALNGKSVPLDQPFPNGADWPGDPSLPDEERANCSCNVTVEVR